jgi:hypothetical protein
VSEHPWELRPSNYLENIIVGVPETKPPGVSPKTQQVHNIGMVNNRK